MIEIPVWLLVVLSALAVPTALLIVIGVVGLAVDIVIGLREMNK